MKFGKFLEALNDAGWRGTCDAQHTEIFKLWQKLFPAAAEYRAELEEALDALEEMREEANYADRSGEDN